MQDASCTLRNKLPPAPSKKAQSLKLSGSSDVHPAATIPFQTPSIEHFELEATSGQVVQASILMSSPNTCLALILTHGVDAPLSM